MTGRPPWRAVNAPTGAFALMLRSQRAAFIRDEKGKRMSNQKTGFANNRRGIRTVLEKRRREGPCAAGKGRRILGGILGLLMMAAILLPGTEALGAEAAQQLNSSGNANRAVSVDPTGRSEGFSAVLYDNSNGLPTSEANAIAETGDGFLWIGSYAGLIRYDGNTFLRMDSTGGLTSIKCLYVDSRDRLWIGTNDNGVGVMERGQLRIWGKLDGMRSAHIRAIAEDPKGIIYVATAAGITMIDSEYHFSFVEDERVAGANMRDIRIGSDGVLYGTTDMGDVMTIQDGRVTAYHPLAESKTGGAGCILPDPAMPGHFYMESADFALHHGHLEGNQFIEDARIEVDPLRYIKSMESIEGKIWICAGNGVGVLDGDSFTVLDNLPMNNNVGHVMTDYLGNLWFTSTRQGVMKVVPNQFSDLFTRFGVPETVVNTTCLLENRLFIGTDTGLIVMDENGPVSSLPLTKAETAGGAPVEATDLIEYLNGARIRSIIRDSQGRMWISTWRTRDLLRYEKGELTVFSQEDGLLSTSVRSVCEGRDGRILVAITGGVNVIEGNKVTASFGKEDGIGNVESLTVEEGPGGEIILGSNGGGLYIITDEGVKSINVEEGLPSDIVMRLKRDEKNNVVWLVTSSAIAYMTPDYRITTVKKFPYTNNFDLYENSKGEIWVLASNGIYVTTAAEMLANQDIHTVHYSIANGLPCIATANSYSDVAENGDLYIAGSTGVCKVNIEQPFENVNELKAVVPYLEADGVAIYPDENGVFFIPKSTQKLTVPSFVFNYSLSNPKVSLKLEGFDRQSLDINRDDMVPVDYTNLRGGTYHYVMRLQDSMGRGDKTVSVEIVKEKYFFEETWFFILAGLLLILAVTGIVHLYARKKTRALEAKQKETMALVGGITEAFAKVIDMKDEYTRGHSTRVAQYTEMLAKELGYDEETVEKFRHIALLHDIGKVGVRQEVLNKAGKLTDEEFNEIKSHTSKGYEALKEISIMPELAIGAQSHHERPDGRGYPNHLKGDEIPRVAQIIAVADCFDAMYSDRPYRKRMNFDKVVSIIKEVSGTQLTPDVVEAFLRLVDKGEFRAEDDHGGGTTENIDNIRKS